MNRTELAEKIEALSSDMIAKETEIFNDTFKDLLESEEPATTALVADLMQFSIEQSIKASSLLLQRTLAELLELSD